MTPEVLAATRGTKSKKPAQLLLLKNEGHHLIDALVQSGVTRTTVYNRMRRRLNRYNGREHFGKMDTVEDAQQAVDLLKSWLMERLGAQEREKNPPPSKKAKKKANVLPRDQYLKAMEEMRRHRERVANPNRWTRLLRWFKIKR